MISICIPLPTKGQFQNQWDYVLSNFQVDVLYVIGSEKDAPKSNVFKNAVYINSADDLPNETLVVLAPKEGRYVQGDEDLKEFTHPEDVIYFFGADESNLSENEMGARVPEHKVFIDTDTRYEMYSWVSFAVVMWDKKMKHG